MNPPNILHARRAILLLACFGLLQLAACDIQLPNSGPAPRLYALSPKVAADPGLPKADWQLVIEAPSAPANLDSVRMAVRRTPVQLDYYANVAWVDRVPAMVQTLLVSAFEDSGKMVAVGRSDVGLRADYLLLIDIRHFEVDNVSGAPAPHVALVAKLIKMPDRQIVADRACDEKQQAAGEALEQIAGAYNLALGRCLKSIVDWTIRSGAAVPPPAR